ncbi:GNAT family N-acetyltransferase, partial [Puia sp.]|uniref:GNAT family N-acetyltransferase n=1 Tax=Puia sp. TaxID=2045100 RepID=UPI002F4035EF
IPPQCPRPGLPIILQLDARRQPSPLYIYPKEKSTMNIQYKTGLIPTTAEIIEVYDSSGINRPTKDPHRIAGMYAHSNLVITAWDDHRLVGISRSLTDLHYSCYLSDLAVRKEFQKQGIGKELVRLTKEALGPTCMLLLLAAPAAIDYYPKIGMDKLDNAFMIKRDH